MGRPGKYGRELKLTNNGEFLALNLGYIFRAEHEGDTASIVEGLNRRYTNKSNLKFQLELIKRMGASAKGLKRAKQEAKQLITDYDKGWNLINSKYRGALKEFQKYVLHPSVNVKKREIRINNNSITGKYRKFLTKNGDYTVICIGNSDIIDKVKDKPSCTEEDFMYMPDYADGMNNIGFAMAMLGNNLNIDNSFIPVCGSWTIGSEDILCLVCREPEYRDVGKQILEAHKRGSLAVVPGLDRIMSDRGCILVDVDALGVYTRQW